MRQVFVFTAGNTEARARTNNSGSKCAWYPGGKCGCNSLAPLLKEVLCAETRSEVHAEV